MRIEQLEYLAAVTRYGSLRRASERLHVSQPALSEAIRKLEQELGVTLLDRHRSGARISLAGRELLQPIVDVLESVDRLKAAAGDQLATRRLLRIGTVNAGTASLVLPAVRAFQAGNGGTAVEVRNLQQDEIQVSLAEGTLDLGLVNLLDGDDVPPELEPTPLLVGRPAAVLPAGHPLATQAEVSADDLRRERFVAMRSGYLMYRFAHRLFGSNLPAAWHSTDGAEMGKMMVAEGIGLTVLPDYSVLGDPLERAGLIVARPLVGDTTVVTMVALHRRQSRVSPAVLDVLRHLRTQAAGVDREARTVRPREQRSRARRTSRQLEAL
ncbi:LysR family transcriptional regulator [Phytohabitans aurantiacus]|nr:LysR family transcriptional regulator [Phytohabitans aurantiacus]